MEPFKSFITKVKKNCKVKYPFFPRDCTFTHKKRATRLNPDSPYYSLYGIVYPGLFTLRIQPHTQSFQFHFSHSDVYFVSAPKTICRWQANLQSLSAGDAESPAGYWLFLAEPTPFASTHVRADMRSSGPFFMAYRQIMRIAP